MFGAPQLPGRPAYAPTPNDRRRPGVGDHVCLCDGHLGLVVDALPGGMVTVARRSKTCREVLELDLLADTLTILPAAPLAFEEARDPTWRRGALG